jgi:hypothetical protein
LLKSRLRRPDCFLPVHNQNFSTLLKSRLRRPHCSLTVHNKKRAPTRSAPLLTDPKLL